MAKTKTAVPVPALVRRKLTVELVDQMLDLYREEPGDQNWDVFMEILWGKANEDSFMLELLTLARVALMHLQSIPKASEILGSGTGGSNEPNQLPRNDKGQFRKAPHDHHSGLHGVAEGEIPGTRS